MEDLANEFAEDFLAALKVLEDFAASDADLREALQEVRARVEAQKYACAPNFWEDLREKLGAISIRRGEEKEDVSAAHHSHRILTKSKAQQLMKQVARLEVKFWAKESTDMLRDVDPDFRLERMVDWIQTFEPSDSGDVSAGPAVLYTVLNDISLQKDMDAAQKETLTNAIKENLHKFPYEMQAVLERVGSLQSGGITTKIVNDWRRRNQPAVQETPVASGPITFVQQPANPGTEGNPAPANPAEDIDGVPLGAGLPEGMQYTTSQNLTEPAGPGDQDIQEVQEDEEERFAAEPFNVQDVPPETMEQARRTVVAMLQSNAGECPKNFVRNILKQVGIGGCPIAALGSEIFFSGVEVFLRRVNAPWTQPALPPPGRSPVPEQLRHQITHLVREAGGRLFLSMLANLLQWHPGSVMHEMHGPLRRAVAQVCEVFFEPNKVFLLEAARQHIAVLAPAAEENDGQPVQQEQAAEESAAAPYVADPFAELLATILAWLQQGGGVLDADVVSRLIKELGFKPRAVISALSREVFWSHREAECEILLRTQGGAAQHPKPLPDVYLHEIVHKDILVRLKEMGQKTKLDKLAGALGWNQKSELRKAYGMLHVVIQGLRGVFYDPQRLYLKKALDGVVQWPVTHKGRMGPDGEGIEAPVMHWTTAADDTKAQGDPEWLNAKRQVLGTIMGHGGQCDVAVLRQLLAGLDGGSIEIEALFEVGSPRDLTALLFWSSDCVCGRQANAVEAAKPQMDAEQIPLDVKSMLINTVRSKGSVSLKALQDVLNEANLAAKVDESTLFRTVQHIPELFFMPNVVFLRHVLKDVITEAPEQEPLVDLSEEALAAKAEERAALLAADADTSEDVAMQALMEAAAALPQQGADAGLATSQGEVASEDGTSTGTKTFLSFGEFEPKPVAHIMEEEAPKRRRLDADVHSDPKAWRDLPPWVTEGAAVAMKKEDPLAEDQVGVIMRVTGSVASVRFLLGNSARGGMAGTGLGNERDLPTSMLLPIAPEIGASVKVVSGSQKGCQGKLVGLAGEKGVVQIGSLNYETLPLSQLATLGAW